MEAGGVGGLVYSQKSVKLYNIRSKLTNTVLSFFGVRMLASSSSGGHRFFLGDTCKEAYKLDIEEGKAKSSSHVARQDAFVTTFLFPIAYL